MIELTMNRIKKYFGATQVLNNITFDVQNGEKVGIVGRNGSGKSTILKIVCGVENYEEGILSIRKGASIGYLDQIPEFPKNYTVADVLESAFERLYQVSHKMHMLEAKMSAIAATATTPTTAPANEPIPAAISKDELKAALDEYSLLQHIFEAEGGYEIEEQMSKISTGLKISDEFKSQLFSTLSGGEKTTVILGKILLQKVDIMLLDEPSNHLDMESIEWLEEYLKEYKGTVLIVSHDRYFLDKVTTKIIEIEDMDSTTYIGNYTNYVETKERDMLLQFEAFKDQQKKIHAMEKAIKDLRDWGLRANNEKFFKRAVSIEKRLEKMNKIEKPIFEKENMKLNFTKTQRSGNDVVIVENLCKSFGDKVLFDHANLLVRHKERTALIGKNGCGKSTLIKLLLKEFEVEHGNAKLGANIKLGYLPQNIIFDHEDYTVLQTFRDNIILPEGKSREYLAKFMFFGESVFKKVNNLSGGERSRLSLAMLMYEDINLLILDEPTNHLDIDSMETLEKTLKAFHGTIFFVSHDRYFINSISSKIVEIKNCDFKSYEGNYDYYKEVKDKEIDEDIQVKVDKAEKVVKADECARTIKADKTDSANKICKVDDTHKLDEVNKYTKSGTSNTKANSNAYKLNTLETKIAELENELNTISNLMDTYSDDYNKLTELLSQKSALQSQLDILMEEWIAIS